MNDFGENPYLNGGDCVQLGSSIYYAGGKKYPNNMPWGSSSNLALYQLPLDGLTGSPSNFQPQWKITKSDLEVSDALSFFQSDEKTTELLYLTYKRETHIVSINSYDTIKTQVKQLASIKIHDKQIGELNTTDHTFISTAKMNDGTDNYIIILDFSEEIFQFPTLFYKYHGKSNQIKLLFNSTIPLGRHFSTIENGTLYLTSRLFTSFKCNLKAFTCQNGIANEADKGDSPVEDFEMFKGARVGDFIHYSTGVELSNSALSNNTFYSFNIIAKKWQKRTVANFESLAKGCFIPYQNLLVQSLGNNNKISNTTSTISTENWELVSPVTDSTSAPNPNTTFEQNSTSDTPAIVGGAVGGTLFVCLVAFLIFFYVKRAKEEKPLEPPEIILDPVWAETKIEDTPYTLSLQSQEHVIDSDINNRVPTDF